VLPAETVIIAGPTGVGKTTLSLRLADRLGGEIVGADAFQIYRGLPLLTAQPTAEEQAGIPHHLIGSVDPLECFDAGRYQRTAEPILHEIVSRGRVPILVGGTGLYLKALLGGLDELPGSDPALRQELSTLDLPDLISRLQTADPQAPAQIDLKNRRRVARALEIVLLTGKALALSRTSSAALTRPSGVRALLLTREREELHSRIASNVASMFSRGVLEEVNALPEEKIGATASMTLGLREVRSALKGEITPAEAQETITLATRRYAKRQLTWLRNQHDFPALDLSIFADQEQAFTKTLSLLAKQ
jgi:tRNA dimethylallyltransferase